jgi:hypothetical protein
MLINWQVIAPKNTHVASVIVWWITRQAYVVESWIISEKKSNI